MAHATISTTHEEKTRSCCKSRGEATCFINDADAYRNGHVNATCCFKCYCSCSRTPLRQSMAIENVWRSVRNHEALSALWIRSHAVSFARQACCKRTSHTFDYCICLGFGGLRCYYSSIDWVMQRGDF